MSDLRLHRRLRYAWPCLEHGFVLRASKDAPIPLRVLGIDLAVETEQVTISLSSVHKNLDIVGIAVFIDVGRHTRFLHNLNLALQELALGPLRTITAKTKFRDDRLGVDVVDAELGKIVNFRAISSALWTVGILPPCQ